MKTLIKGGTLVNKGQSHKGDLLIENDRISRTFPTGSCPDGDYDQIIDATGCFVLPGIIDTHVHFREPGLTAKADIESESRAAACGGVTSYCEMPNTVPQTTSLEALEEKFRLAADHSHVNYSFYFGATNGNAALFHLLDRHRVPAIKLFMGASTGNMLVDKYGSLLDIFRSAKEVGLPVMTHCEDSDIISANMAAMKKQYGEDPNVALHPLIRSAEACYQSSALAVELAHAFGTRLHIAHISTAKELELLRPEEGITGEAVVAHLWFTAEDYAAKGALIKCNPAVKGQEDRQALRKALADGRIYTIATDHAPHEWQAKQGGCARAASGMPMVQFSLVTMLELVNQGVLTIEKLVELMCHHPAQLFDIQERGFLNPGYKADVVVVSPSEPWTVTKDIIQSKCQWSPMEGETYHWQVRQTFCNGQLIYDNGHFDSQSQGEELRFRP